MKERPILFSGAMVRAIREGRKSQTRRVVSNKELIELFDFLGGDATDEDSEGLRISYVQDIERRNEEAGVSYRYSGLLVASEEAPEEGYEEIVCPYGVPGDRLWVRETWQPHPEFDHISGPGGVIYRADPGGDYQHPDGKWKPSIFMPRWASRITLEVVSVRVERVQWISEGDAIAEGIVTTGERKSGKGEFWYGLPDNCGIPFAPHSELTAARAYEKLWECINGKGSWAANPWVWVVTFSKVATVLAETEK